MVNRNTLIHIKSNTVLENGSPKLPSADKINYGEIAINYAKDNETMSMKNDNNEIVEFKSKDYYEDKLHHIYVSGTTLVIEQYTGTTDFNVQTY